MELQYICGYLSRTDNRIIERKYHDPGSMLEDGKVLIIYGARQVEKSFVIHSLGGFSRNLRKEITSKRKYYFLDVGDQSNQQTLSQKSTGAQSAESWKVRHCLE